MKKLLLAAAALLPATLVAILYVWFETRESPSNVAPSARESASDARTSQDQLLALGSAPVTLDGAGPGGEQVTERAAPSEAARRVELDRSDLAPLAGSVAIPRDTPADEVLEVLVFGDGGDPSQIAADSAEFALAAHERLIARAPVARDGSFQVDAPEQGEAWVALRARYLFLESAVRIDEQRGALRLEPRLGAWITGHVRLPRDATAEDFEHRESKLELRFDPLQLAGAFTGGSGVPKGLRVYETRCASDLAFEFRGVTPELDYDLRVTPERFAAHKGDAFRTKAGQHAVVDVDLLHGGTIVGRLRDSDGNAVAAAQVEATFDPVVWGQGGFVARDTKSDEHGAFELAAVTPGKIDLVAKREGYLERRTQVEVADGESVDVGALVIGRGSVIAGQVRWSNGDPVAEVNVKVGFDPAALGGMSALNALQGAEGSAKTDADGRFEVAGLGKGPFVVNCSARPEGADASTPSWRAKAAGVKPDTRDLELVLAEPLAVAGRVVDRQGQPVANFRVTAREETGGMLSGIGGRTESERFEDPDGRFTLYGLSGGEWSLDAQAEGFTRSAPVPVSMPVAADAAPIELVLDRGANVSGVVLSIAGIPVAGADVRLKLSLQDMLKMRGAEDFQPPRSTTDAEGRFRIENLSAGKLAFVASAEGCADSEPAEVELAPEQEVGDVTLQLRVGGRITGEVYGEGGKPVTGGQVMVQLTQDPLVQRFTNTDSEGRFEAAHITPGTWNVIYLPMDSMRQGAGDGESADFMAMFGDMKMSSASVADGEEAHVVLGAPPTDPVNVHGRVLASGEGVPRTMITFIADSSLSLQGLKFVSTDAQGRYQIQLGSPGRYSVSVQKVGMSGEQQTYALVTQIPAGPDFEYDIELPLGAVAGTVYGIDGKPASHARVSLSTDGAVQNGTLMGQQFAEITTDDEGHYELIWLKPGSYAVAAGGTPFGGLFGSGGATAGRQLRTGVEVAKGQRVEGVDFRLRKPGKLTGTVRGPDGKPVNGAAIFVRDSNGRPLERFSMVATDGAGRFTYDGLEPGEYSVLARSSELASSETDQVRVREGETSEIEVRLGAGTMLVVTLTDDEGEPLDCSVEVLDDQGRQVNGMMSLSEIMQAMSQGKFSSKEQRVGPLPPGKYRVIVTTPDGRKTNKPVNLSGQAERKLNVRL